MERPEPLPIAVLADRDDDRGAAELLLEASRDDPDHPGCQPSPDTKATARLP
jgi:hypothetical protein